MKRFNLTRNKWSQCIATLRPYLFAVFGFALLTSANFVSAQVPSPSPLLVNPSVDDFRNAMPTPSLGEEDEPCPEGLICRGPGPSETRARSFNVVIPFGFDSDRLTGEALAILRNLATVLNEERMRFIKSVDVAGHSDAVGNAAYNKVLSRRRAQAVRDALQKFELSRLPLRAYGYGMERLRNASNPKAPENRRVEFVIRY